MKMRHRAAGNLDLRARKDDLAHADAADTIPLKRRFAALEVGMGAAIRITCMDYTAAELRAVAAECSDVGQTRRLLAIAMILDGASRFDAARQAGMHRQTLRHWVRRYNEAGIHGLVWRKAPGAAAKLTQAQMAELRELVIAGPDREVHKVIRWRCVDLCAERWRRTLSTN
jgi:transposase